MRLLNGYKTKSLFPCSMDQKMDEVSVQTHPGSKLHVMYQTVRSANLNSLNWCHRLFEGSYMRYRIHQRQIKRVIQQSCRVFIRMGNVKKSIQLRMVKVHHRKTDARKDCWSKTTRHYLEWITHYIKDKHVQTLYTSSFALIIAEHLDSLICCCYMYL